MQGLNHVVFGSLIAVTVKEPALAVPLAVASHFVLDVVPHYGEDPLTARGTAGYHIRIWVDAIACVAFVLWALSLHPANPTLVIICALMAVTPDFLWPLALKAKHKGPLWFFFKFHKNIQHESRAGIWLEIPWFLITSGLLYVAIR